MPVVELEYAHLSKLTGIKSHKKLLEALPYLGLDIEGDDKTKVRVEYSPNRPDYSTRYGIAASLQYMIANRTPKIKPVLNRKKFGSIRVKKSVGVIRPFILGVVGRGRKLDDTDIKALMSMQEDLHSGIGRGRRKSSIGIHNLGAISFPLEYKTETLLHSFTPLGSDTDASIQNILEKTEIGQAYGHLVKGHLRAPILTDSKGNTISLPPVINAASTALKSGMKDVFVEVTGTAKRDVEDALSVVALTLSEMGFSLYPVSVSGYGNSTAKLGSHSIKLAPKLVSETLGLEMSTSQVRNSLAKSGIASKVSGKNILCNIPPHRFDIFSPMDLVEEAILGYGVQNIEPRLSEHSFIGTTSVVSDTKRMLGNVMIGLGCTEAKNSALAKGDVKKNLTVSDPDGSSSIVLRDSLLDGLLNSLSHNVHESYPQRLFEIGTVFSNKTPVREQIRLCVALVHGDANYTEAKSLLQATLVVFGKNAKTIPAKHTMITEGKCATVQIDGKNIGVVGSVNEQTRSKYKIRQPVSIFEISISGLIFN